MDSQAAKLTRQKNKELREARRAEREAQEKEDKSIVLEALRSVLKDPKATTAQRLYAVAVLDNLEHYGFVPYGLKYTSDGKPVDLSAFAKEVEAIQQSGRNQ